MKLFSKHKFNARNINYNGISFRSKKEGNRYLELLMMQKAGKVVFFLMQVPFRLAGGVKYVVDFVVFWENGNITFEDVKGYKTPMYITKKKMVEDIYPIQIKEI